MWDGFVIGVESLDRPSFPLSYSTIRREQGEIRAGHGGHLVARHGGGRDCVKARSSSRAGEARNQANRRRCVAADTTSPFLTTHSRADDAHRPPVSMTVLAAGFQGK